MRDKEDLKIFQSYFQSLENKKLKFDEDAILSEYQKNEDHQSLAIKILSVFGGLLASLAFIGALFITGLYNSGFGLSIFGIICVLAAIWINKEHDKIIIDTLSVSLFVIGFILFGLGSDKLNISENIISIVFILFSILSLSIVQNYILSFISVLAINGSVLSLIISNDNYNLIHIYVGLLTMIITYFFMNEAKIITKGIKISKLYNPVRIGLIFSFLFGLIILGKKGLLPISTNYIWLSSVVIIASIIYLLSNLVEKLGIIKTQHKTTVCILSVLVLLPSSLSPAISGAILIILLCFLVNYKTGLVIGIIAFIYFVSQYYYDLNFTLLTKSILLISSGILFIALYLFSHKKLMSNEKI